MDGIGRRRAVQLEQGGKIGNAGKGGALLGQIQSDGGYSGLRLLPRAVYVVAVRLVDKRKELFIGANPVGQDA